MNIFVSTQAAGALQVMTLESCDNRLNIKIRNMPCKNDDEGLITKIKYFNIGGKKYLVIAKISGLVQLFQCISTSTHYQLIKEWKNSTVSPDDLIIAIGIYNKQYLYTCSYEGKFILRDLVNDDADGSYKVFMVHRAISKIEVAQQGTNVLLMVVGREVDLRVYKIDIDSVHRVIRKDHPTQENHHGSNLFRDGELRPQHRISTLGTLHNVIFSLTQASRGTVTRDNYIDHNRRHYNWNAQRLSPIWISSDQRLDTDTTVKVSNLGMTSICFLGNGLVACGTQFGKIILYDFTADCDVQIVGVSVFSISALFQFMDHYLIYADSMSQIGVLDVRTGKVLIEYKNLGIGPVSAIKVIASQRSGQTKGKGLRFAPVYVLCSSLEKQLVICKLFDDGYSEEILSVELFEQLVVCLDISGGRSYAQFNQLFGDLSNTIEEPESDHEHELLKVCRKRKITNDVSPPIGEAIKLQKKAIHGLAT